MLGMDSLVFSRDRVTSDAFSKEPIELVVKLVFGISYERGE